MARYSNEYRDRLIVKEYGFLFFAKNMGQNISNHLSSKYSQKLLDHTKHYATDAFKPALKGRLKGIAEEVGNLLGHRITDVVVKSYDALNCKVFQTVCPKQAKYQ